MAEHTPPEQAPESKPAPVPLNELQFELVASVRGLIKVRGVLQEHEGRLNDLTPKPQNFRPLVGSYAEVAERAKRLNDVQMDSGFLDYLYSPEPRKEALV